MYSSFIMISIFIRFLAPCQILVLPHLFWHWELINMTLFPGGLIEIGCFPTRGNCVKPDNQIRACRWRSSCHVCVQNVLVQLLGQTCDSPEKRERIEQTSWSLRALTVFMMRFLSASLSGRMGCLRGGLCSMRRNCQVFVILLFLPAEPRVWEEYLTDEREGKQRILGQSEGMTEHASEMCLN